MDCWDPVGMWRVTANALFGQVHHFDVLKEKEIKFYQKKKAFEQQVAAKAAAANAQSGSKGA